MTPPSGALVHDLTQQVPQLIRSELRLAQAEMTEKGKRAGHRDRHVRRAGLLAFFGARLRRSRPRSSALAHALPDWLVGPARRGGAVRRRRRGSRWSARRRSEQATPPAPEQAIEGVKEDIAVVKGDRSMSDHRTPAEHRGRDRRAARRSWRRPVDQLTHKLDVKAQAKERAAQVADRATTDDGRPRPELVGGRCRPPCCWRRSLVWWRRR